LSGTQGEARHVSLQCMLSPLSPFLWGKDPIWVHLRLKAVQEGFRPGAVNSLES
jgi:hypothetical protein